MPNQNDPTQNLNPVTTPIDQPTNQRTNQPADSDPPIIFPQSDLPPLSPVFSTTGESGSAEQSAKKDDMPSTSSISSAAGSSAPPDVSSVTSKPKKKFGGGKIIATILGLVVLVGGVGAGVLLTQQQQVVSPKACTGNNLVCNGLTKDIAQPKLSDNVTFTCEGNSSSENPVAQFRWRVDDGGWTIEEPDVQMNSATHKATKQGNIYRSGTWIWQCRICTDSTKITCTAWSQTN